MRRPPAHKLILFCFLAILIISYPFASHLAHQITHELAVGHVHGAHHDSLPHEDVELKDPLQAVIKNVQYKIGIAALFFFAVAWLGWAMFSRGTTRDYFYFKEAFLPTKTVFQNSSVLPHAPPA